MKYVLIFLSLFISSFAWADQKIVGHMDPFPYERLAAPIALADCPGYTIYEWRGTKPSQKYIDRLNGICNRAMREFWPFIAAKGLKPLNDEPFKYSMALLPDTKTYRGMNDIKYRFAYRYIKDEVWAYTSRDMHWMWMVSSIDIKEIPQIFSHETFHAMSVHYGLFDAHANTVAERVRIDEELAQEFTEYLGLGR